MIEMWRAGGGSIPYVYGIGYWTGEDNDLLCVKKCKSNIEAEKHLSPLHTNPLISIFNFLVKRLQINLN